MSTVVIQSKIFLTRTPFAKTLLCAHKTRTHTQTQTPLGVYIYFTNNVLDFTVELDTSAIVMGK